MKKQKSDTLPGYAFQKLTEDLCGILRRAFEAYLVWETFGDLIRSVRPRSAEYSRVFYFQPLTHACVDSAFDSFVTNLYKFHDNRSYELKTLVDVGVKHGVIEPWLEPVLRARVEDAAVFATKMKLSSLRNRNVGHYDILAEKRSSLTTVHPTPKEIREYFAKVADIMNYCVERARFKHRPFTYNQFEEQIRSNAQILTEFIRGKGAT